MQRRQTGCDTIRKRSGGYSMVALDGKECAERERERERQAESEVNTFSIKMNNIISSVKLSKE